MGTRTISIDQFAKLVRSLPEDVEKAAIRGLRSAAMRAVTEVVIEIDNADPDAAVNTGAMRQSVRYYPLPDGGHVIVEAPHAAFMEHGTRPHFPPLAPIFEWVMRKGLAADEEEGQAIAWAVAQAIATFGIEPRHFFQKAIARVRRRIVPQEIKRELQDLARSRGGA